MLIFFIIGREWVLFFRNMPAKKFAVMGRKSYDERFWSRTQAEQRIRKRGRVRMGRRICGRTAWMLLVLSAGSVGVADTVYTVGGGKYVGKARTEGEYVLVEIPGGSIRLDRDTVLRIEPGDDLSSRLAEMRAGLGARDADAHYKLGLWAVQNNLPAAARDLFLTAVRIQPDHVQAHLWLGRAFLDGAWLEADQVADTLRQWLAADLNAAVLSVGRQSLSGLMPPSSRRAMLEIASTAARRLGCYVDAMSYYQELATMLGSADPLTDRVAATIEVLRANPSGLYLVQSDELSQAVGRSAGEPERRSGYYPLADDAVLEIALRDRAKDLIGQGQARMAAAANLLLTDAPKAVASFKTAEETFAKADGVSSGIARSYRVEIRRRLIQMHQTQAEALALRFDGLVRTINNRSGADYRNKLRLGLALLEDVQKELDPILALAGPYPQEFSLVIAWTQEDLLTVKAMRRTLEGEFEKTK